MRLVALLSAVATTACYQAERGPLCGDESIEEALAEARPGDVVRLGACRIRGAFVVPAGVRLEGAGRDLTELSGPEAGVTLVLTPGTETTVVEALSVRSRGCAGILASGPGAVRVKDVAVHSELGLGLGLQGGVTATIEDVVLAGPVTADNAPGWAPDGGGLPTLGLAASEVAMLELSRVEARGFGTAGVALLDSASRWASGLVVDNLGAGVLVSGGTLQLDEVEVVRTLGGARLLPSLGVVLHDGAAVDAAALTVRDGDGLGILSIGASGRLEDVVVERNGDVGVWISGATSLALEGGRIADNSLVGVLVQESSGVTLRDLVVERTGWATVIAQQGAAEIADGIELSGSTSEIVIDRVTLLAHPRAGAVLDLAGGDGAGITLREVAVEGDALGVVVQGGRARPGWDAEVARSGDTGVNDADFVARGDALRVPDTAAPPPAEPPSPRPLLCGP